MPIDEMSEEEFRKKLQECVDKFKLGHRDLAHIAGASVPTITRWLTGQSSPHRFIRRVVLEQIRAECLD